MRSGYNDPSKCKCWKLFRATLSLISIARRLDWRADAKVTVSKLWMVTVRCAWVFFSRQLKSRTETTPWNKVYFFIFFHKHIYLYRECKVFSPLRIMPCGPYVSYGDFIPRFRIPTVFLSTIGHLLQQTGAFFLVSEYIVTVAPPILDIFFQIIIILKHLCGQS